MNEWIKNIRYLQLGPDAEAVSIKLPEGNGEENSDTSSEPGKLRVGSSERLVPSRPVTYIRTLRNSQSGRVPVKLVPQHY